MKRKKQFFAMLLTLLLLFSLAVPAFAAENDTVTISIQNTAAAVADGAITRTYDGYRLLNLTTSGTGEDAKYAYTLNDKYAGILRELVYGVDNWPENMGSKPADKDDVTQAQIITYLGSLTSDTKDETAGEITQMGTIRGFMEEVYKKIKAASLSADVSGHNGTFNDVAQGYWMIVDTTVISGHDSHSLIVVDTKGQDEIVVTPKVAVPTVDKQVQENSSKIWGDNADYNIGDDVPFKLTGTVDQYYDYYDTYQFVFHDTLSNGLKLDDTFGNSNVTVMVDGTKITSGFTVETSSLGDNCTFHVTFTDLKQIPSVKANSVITVEYTAELTAGAVIGNDGNPNSVKLEFSNDPNHSGAGTPPTGETPEEKVVVFTYELDVDKVDGSSKGDDGNYGKHLQDAWFVLYRMNGQTKEYAEIDANGKIAGWSTTMPKHTKDGEQVDGNLQSGANGIFKVIGLDQGDFYLEETVAPAGFNLLSAPLKLTVAATTKADSNNDGLVELNTLTVTVDNGAAQNGNVDQGTISIIVENMSGTELPSTGGTGTAIFYVAGGILVVGAVLFFVTRKRMSVTGE